MLAFLFCSCKKKKSNAIHIHICNYSISSWFQSLNPIAAIYGMPTMCLLCWLLCINYLMQFSTFWLIFQSIPYVQDISPSQSLSVHSKNLLHLQKDFKKIFPFLVQKRLLELLFLKTEFRQIKIT